MKYANSAVAVGPLCSQGAAAETAQVQLAQSAPAEIAELEGWLTIRDVFYSQKALVENQR